MKVFVEITAPVSAKFILAGFEDSVVADVLIRLHTNDAGVVKNISLTKETDYQQVPKFTLKNKHGNIFEPESADVAYLEERLVVIEGFISNIGVEYVDFSRIGRRWFKSESIYADEETIFGYSTDHDKRPSPTRIINGDLLLQFFKMALKEKNDTASLALRFFQRGQAYFSNFRYVDCIHEFSLFIELNFANGKFGKKDQVVEFKNSAVFLKSFSEAKKGILAEVKNGDISIADAKSLLIDKKLDNFANWVADTRGQFFHQSSKRNKTWTPSRSIQQKKDATVLAVFCAAAANEIIGLLPFDPN